MKQNYGGLIFITQIIDLLNTCFHEKLITYGFSILILFYSGTNLFGPLGHRMGRWLASFIGLSLIGLALIFVSFIAFPQLKAENHMYNYTRIEPFHCYQINKVLPSVKSMLKMLVDTRFKLDLSYVK